MVATVLLIFASVFLGVFALVYAGATAGQSPAARLKKRLHRLAEEDARKSAVPAGEDLLQGLAPVERFFYGLPLMMRAKRLVERSGVAVSPIFFVLWTSTASVSCFLGLYLWKGRALIAFPAAFAVVLGALSYLEYRKKKREESFTEQLPEVLTMISRSLRAGHSLTGAVELVSEELSEPAGSLFRVAYEQQKLGMRMADSLATLPDKIDSIDLRFFITIIRINSETGGNLGEILDKLAETIRSRLQIRRQVQVYTAEGRVSGYVLVILPAAVFALFYLVRPDYMSVFFTERTCQLILAAAAMAQVIGFLFIKKIVNVKI